MTSQSGSGSTPAGSAGGVLGGTYPAPIFATNGTTRILGTVSAHLGADVPMSSTNTPFDGPSITLSAGTWWVDGHTTLQNSGGGSANFTVKLWDGTTVFDSAESDAPALFTTEVVVGWSIVVATTATVKLTAFSSSGGGVIKAAATVNGQGNSASMLRALRIA